MNIKWLRKQFKVSQIVFSMDGIGEGLSQLPCECCPVRGYIDWLRQGDNLVKAGDIKASSNATSAIARPFLSQLNQVNLTAA